MTTAAFSADYVAQFQLLTSSTCSTPDLSVRSYCYGNIVLLSVSDSSIQCDEVAKQDSDGWSYIDCTSKLSCTSTSCTSPSISTQEDFLYWDPNTFGEIEFRCYGESLNDVDASFWFLDSSDGFGCTSTFTSTHSIRLGISCPSDSDGGNIYKFDDSYTTCTKGYLATADTAPSNEIVCYNKMDCTSYGFGYSNCYPTFGELIINANLPQYKHDCVQSTTTLEISNSSPTIAPTSDSYVYTTTYAAAWNAPVSSNCTDSSPTIRISCIGSFIENIQPSSVTISCTKASDSDLDCYDEDPNFVSNEFSRIRYDCVGRSLPHTIVQYPESEATCIQSTSELIAHQLQVGVQCNRYNEPRFEYNKYARCLQEDATVGYNDDGNGDSSFTCYQEASLSSTNTNKVIPVLTMSLSVPEDDISDCSVKSVDVYTPPPVLIGSNPYPPPSPNGSGGSSNRGNSPVDVSASIKTSKQSSKKGKKAGIAVGVTIGGLLFFISFTTYCRKKKQNQANIPSTKPSTSSLTNDNGKEQPISSSLDGKNNNDTGHSDDTTNSNTDATSLTNMASNGNKISPQSNNTSSQNPGKVKPPIGGPNQPMHSQQPVPGSTSQQNAIEANDETTTTSINIEVTGTMEQDDNPLDGIINGEDQGDGLAVGFAISHNDEVVIDGDVNINIDEAPPTEDDPTNDVNGLGGLVTPIDPVGMDYFTALRNNYNTA